MKPKIKGDWEQGHLVPGVTGIRTYDFGGLKEHSGIQRVCPEPENAGHAKNMPSHLRGRNDGAHDICVKSFREKSSLLTETYDSHTYAEWKSECDEYRTACKDKPAASQKAKDAVAAFRDLATTFDAWLKHLADLRGDLVKAGVIQMEQAEQARARRDKNSRYVSFSKCTLHSGTQNCIDCDTLGNYLARKAEEFEDKFKLSTIDTRRSASPAKGYKSVQ